MTNANILLTLLPEELAEVAKLLDVQPTEVEFSYQENNGWKVYTIKDNKPRGYVTREYGQFYLNQFPGCCGVEVLHNFLTGSKHQFAGLILKIAERLAIEANYSILVITDNHSDNLNRENLLASGWHEWVNFENRNTNNRVYGLWKEIWKGATAAVSRV